MYHNHGNSFDSISHRLVSALFCTKIRCQTLVSYGTLNKIRCFWFVVLNIMWKQSHKFSQFKCKSTTLCSWHNVNKYYITISQSTKYIYLGKLILFLFSLVLDKYNRLDNRGTFLNRGSSCSKRKCPDYRVSTVPGMLTD